MLPGGYGEITDALAALLPGLRLSTPVAAVEDTGDGVRVTTASGAVMDLIIARTVGTRSECPGVWGLCCRACGCSRPPRRWRTAQTTCTSRQPQTCMPWLLKAASMSGHILPTASAAHCAAAVQLPRRKVASVGQAAGRCPEPRPFMHDAAHTSPKRCHALAECMNTCHTSRRRGD